MHITLAFILLNGIYNSIPSVEVEPNFAQQTTDTLNYTNPVFEPVLADPTVVQVGDEFFAYGTEDNWG